MQITNSSYVNAAFYKRDPTQPAEQNSGQAQDLSKQQVKAENDSELLRQVETLKARDREVRAHEQAHLSAAGGIAISGAQFQYTSGPDGKRYATGGEVSIDTSTVPGDPQATLRKAETIRRAALAPAHPSSQDYKVAAKAAAMANKASAELMQGDPERTGSLINITA